MLRQHPQADIRPAGALRRTLRYLFELSSRAAPRARGLLYRALLGYPFERAGKDLRISGMGSISIGRCFSAGDGCWIEAIERYRGQRYRPQLLIGSFVSLSSWTHVSCAARIVLGDGCLIGSKVYIGDHRHGVYAKDGGRGAADYTGDGAGDGRGPYPGEMPLAELAPIEIGAGTWVGDGAVILGGSQIAPGSIVGANSVVRLAEPRPALIAGVPARVLAYLDQGPEL